ncbi:hypothetical protein Syun_015987 [Stephania yunnanensis]|uniref:Uncharacterized protein n=1 Tax=Stephania yunnanensis TaxID=152371 RepID=A0AAP0J525_9MAGN
MTSWAAIGSSSARFTACGSRPRKPNAAPPKHKTSTVNSVGFGSKSGKEAVWQCVEGCGACCKLNKGPSFATPEEIFQSPSDIQLYKSLIGPDGWCVHFDKPTRTCTIYSDRPYFCRVEPGIFRDLYGIEHKKFNKEACSFCRDTIKAIYGSRSRELENFNQITRRNSSSLENGK